MEVKMFTYVISSGSYSDYGISYIVQSEKEISDEKFREYYLESIKRSSDFEDEQLNKLRKYMNDAAIESTSWFNGRNILKGKDWKVEFDKWEELCKEAGIVRNPRNWYEEILKENGVLILDYKDFNTDDWD
jgi:hypothetical protein